MVDGMRKSPSSRSRYMPRVRTLALADVLLLGALVVGATGKTAHPTDGRPRSGPMDEVGDRVGVAGQADTASSLEIEIRDPLYEFVIGLAIDDSLGTWDQADLKAYVERSQRRSALPWEEIVRIVRREARPGEAETCRGARVTRMWELTIRRSVCMPMPYSFLGYHPGTLFIADHFVASEWQLGTRTLFIARDGLAVQHLIESVIVFRVDEGIFALDVDAWVDKVLGRRLDDFYVNGFALCREEGRLREISLLTTRSGRDDFGQFDLQRDRSVADPDETARGLASFARPWVRPPADQAAPWPRLLK